MRLGHVLISSAGRKAPMVGSLVEAAARVSVGTRILTSDLDDAAPAHRIGHGRVPLPPLDGASGTAPRELLELLRRHGVALVVPTRDGELAFWAECREALARGGVDVVVASAATTSMLLDKLEFARHGAEAGLPVIPTTTAPSGSGPFVVKERFGAGSRSILVGGNRSRAEEHARGLAAPVFQPLIEGEEFSADAWIGRSGELRGPVIRRRETVMDGESVVTTTLRDRQLEEVATRVLAWRPPRGPVNVQIIRDAEGTANVIEVNPRFGGASTCSIAVGLDVWGWELAEQSGTALPPYVRAPGEIRQTRTRMPDGSSRDLLERVPVGAA